MDPEVDVVGCGDLALPDLKGWHSFVEAEVNIPVSSVVVRPEGELRIVSGLPLVGHLQVGTFLPTKLLISSWEGGRGLTVKLCEVVVDLVVVDVDLVVVDVVSVDVVGVGWSVVGPYPPEQ